MSRQLTIEHAELALRCLTGLDVVLIGGQALQHWCREYQHAPELAGQILTSKDIDLQATKDALFAAAHRLGAEAKSATMSALPMLGVVDFDPRDGEGPIRIDFLIAPTGLRPTDVFESAIKLEARGISLRVMHPIHCLVSRIENVFQAPQKYDNPHGLQQLRASIVCAREFILALARVDVEGAEAAARDAGKICQSKASCWLWRTKAIDVTLAIPRSGLSPTFYTDRLPKILARIDRVRNASA